MERCADAVYALSRQILGESGHPLADYDRTTMRALERIRSSGLTSTALGDLAFQVGGAINVKAWPYLATGNGVTDDTAALQAALDAAQAGGGIPIVVPAGTYVVTSTLTWLTAATEGPGPTILGAGRFATIFDHRVANGPLFRVDQTATIKFARGGACKGFAIRTTTNPANADGLSLSALYQWLLEDVWIDGLTGTGIVIDIQLGDGDGPVMLVFDRVWVEHCAGYGLNVTQSGASSENSCVQARSCFFQYNTLGGARVRQLGGTWMDCAFVRNSPGGQGVGGMQLYATAAGTSRTTKLIGVTFEGNGVCQLDIQSCTNLVAEQCESLHNPSDIAANPITVGVKIGGSGISGASVAHIDLRGWFVRASTPGYVQFAIGSDAVYTRIRLTRWDVFDTGTETRIADSGVKSRIEDDGVEWPACLSTVSTVLAAPATYTPDAVQYAAHRLDITGTGAYVIATPTTGSQGASHGKWILLDVFNHSGGAITVTFGASLIVSGYTNPANGIHRTALFYKDNQSLWQQVGAWNA